MRLTEKCRPSCTELGTPPPDPHQTPGHRVGGESREQKEDRGERDQH